MRKIKLLNGVFALLLAVVMLASCMSDAPERLDLVEGLPVPSGASGVSRMQLDRNPHRQQLFFVVKAAYPNAAPMEGFQRHFEKNGWTRCQGKMSSWDSFVDMSSNPAVRVHQIASIWTSADNKTFAFVVGRYLSKPDAPISKPDNDDQRWVAVVHRNVDAAREAKELGYTCSKT